MVKCKLCKGTAAYISGSLGVCPACIRQRSADALIYAEQAHLQSRTAFGLPPNPPDDIEGVACHICVNRCKIPLNKTGYCGLRRNADRRLAGVSSAEGNLSWYHDPLPTNCVGDWVCAGGTGAGYPKYALRPWAETGYPLFYVHYALKPLQRSTIGNSESFCHGRREYLKVTRRPGADLAIRIIDEPFQHRIPLTI